MLKEINREIGWVVAGSGFIFSFLWWTLEVVFIEPSHWAIGLFIVPWYLLFRHKKKDKNLPSWLADGQALQTKRLPNGKRKLLCDLEVRVKNTDIGLATGKDKFVIRKNFVTDFSSIPTLLQWTVRWSTVDIAGVVHDWLYHKEGYKEIQNIRFPRWEADRMWRDIALSGSNRVAFGQASVCWLVLVLGGRRRWNQLRRKSVPVVPTFRRRSKGYLRRKALPLIGLFFCIVCFVLSIKFQREIGVIPSKLATTAAMLMATRLAAML